ncbi:hypothetical protein E4J93_00285 [Collinsella sp. BA40]|uniref:hypothetical protein n=1 Tax=Collinsella sp. BA40 TaxID=2560852 RepID=UPI0011C7ECBF|nr:hypothetical protein [Collinsella sp. BA40]TXF38935.1 hypothetical protein E4J93_00285 [Collinsella sp. BA40]
MWVIARHSAEPCCSAFHARIVRKTRFTCADDPAKRNGFAVGGSEEKESGAARFSNSVTRPALQFVFFFQIASKKKLVFFPKKKEMKMPSP